MNSSLLSRLFSERPVNFIVKSHCIFLKPTAVNQISFNCIALITENYWITRFAFDKSLARLFWNFVETLSLQPALQKICVPDTNFVSGTQKCFWFCSETFVSATNVSQFAQPKKHHGQQCVRNNVSSFTRAFWVSSFLRREALLGTFQPEVKKRNQKDLALKYLFHEIIKIKKTYL